MKVQRLTWASLTPEQRNFLKVIGFAVMCVSFFILHIGLRTLVVTKGYEVSRLRREVADRESALASLKVEKNRVMSSKRLEELSERFAERGIQFASPKANQLLYIKANRD